MNTAHASTTPAPQHLRALARANEVRLARAELKRRVGHGQVTVAEVLLSTPWEAESMTISDLLMSQRRWGITRCRKLLLTVGLSENKAVGSMTERQRVALAELLCPPNGRPAAARREGTRARALAFGLA